MFDSSHNRTTGNDVLDGMVNGIGCILMLATISFALLTMALYDYKLLVQIWLYFSCIRIIFGVFASFIVDAFKAFGYTEPPLIPTLILVASYGGIGVMAFFNKNAPLVLHQIYVICNCSLVTVFYLRMFPAHTAWFVLSCVILWDAFAVLAPIGPLRRINEKAPEYSAQVLRFLMFTAEDPHFTVKHTHITCDDSHHEHEEADLSIEIPNSAEQSQDQKRASGGKENSDVESDQSDTKTAASFTEEDQAEMYDQAEVYVEGLRYRRRAGTDSGSFETIDSVDSEADVVECDDSDDKPEAFTAYDALNDGSSIRLGMGDFVFYSLLVGKAAASGSAMCTIGATIGVIVGLLVTLSLFSKDDETTPALPVSIAFGLIIHFGILLFIQPFLEHIHQHAFIML